MRILKAFVAFKQYISERSGNVQRRRD